MELLVQGIMCRAECHRQTLKNSETMHFRTCIDINFLLSIYEQLIPEVTPCISETPCIKSSDGRIDE
jgi:hypothetical protein